jgi:hypothetical protein
MRRFPLLVALFCSLALILGLSACGGSSTSPITAASVTLTPVLASMNRGDVLQLTATALEKDGTTATPADFTFTSSNSSLVSVSTAGNVCAGTWDATFVVCTPATTTGTATVTVTITKTPSITASSTVTVHEKVDRVQLNNVGSTCLSSTKTQQLSAVAQSTNPAVCSSLGTTAPCNLPNSSLGQFTFSASDPDVLTIDNVTTPGLATAANPGATSIIASISGVNSSAQNFTVCPITSLTYKNTATSDQAPFTIAKAGTQSVTVTAIDSAGVTLATPPVTFVSGNIYALTAATATGATGTITGANSGTTALTYAECASPSCNKHMAPVYSTGIVGTVSGTYNPPTVYVGSTNSLNLFPIDTSNNTVGTVIALPYLPNSLFINHQGTQGILGSDNNPLMLLDTAGNSISTFATLTGVKVLAMSPDGSFSLVTNTAGTFIINLSAKTAPQSSTVGKAIKGTFSPDSRFAYFTTGTSTLYVFDLNAGTLFTFNEGSNINDIAVLANGPVAYLAQAAAVNAVGTCNLQLPGFVDSQSAASASSLMSLPNASGIAALNGNSLLLINNTTATQACPPVVSESQTSIPLTFSAGNPAQMLVTADSGKAVVTSSGKEVAVVTLGANTSKSVALAASASVSGTGDLTADSASFYVSGSDNAVHKIDLAGGTDAAQIAVTLKDASSATVTPNLIAVRNK